MLKKFVTIAILAMITTAFAQGNKGLHELLMKNRRFECADLFLNAQRLVPDYYDLGELDSLNLVIDYVDRHCETKMFSWLQILLAMKAGKFSDDWCDSAIVWRAAQAGYHDRMVLDSMKSSVYYSYHDPEYYIFLRRLTSSLIKQSDSNSLAFALCSSYLYEKNEIYDRLRKKRYPGTRIQEMYDNLASHISDKLQVWRVHYALGLGIWSPTGKAEILGKQTEINLSVRILERDIGIDFFGAIRPTSSRHGFNVLRNDSLVTVEYFWGYQIGFQFAKEMIKLERYRIGGFAGFGYDGFNALGDGDNKHKSISTPSFSLGINTRLFLRKFVGPTMTIQFRYDMFDYNNRGGTNLRGNAFSLSLAFGLMKGNKYWLDLAERLRIVD